MWNCVALGCGGLSVGGSGPLFLDLVESNCLFIDSDEIVDGLVAHTLGVHQSTSRSAALACFEEFIAVEL